MTDKQYGEPEGTDVTAETETVAETAELEERNIDAEQAGRDDGPAEDFGADGSSAESFGTEEPLAANEETVHPQDAVEEYSPFDDPPAQDKSDESDETADAADNVAAPAPVKKPSEVGKVKKVKEVLPSFPPLGVAPQAPATMLSRLFGGGAFISPLLLTALLLAQVFFGLQSTRALWLPEETALAEVLHNVLNGDWIILMLNGEIYFETPPLYFWFLAGIHKLLSLPFIQTFLPATGDELARTMFVGTALSGLLLLWATLFMARWAARLDMRGLFAAGCVLLSMFLFAGSLHYCGVNLFFAAMVITSQTFIFQAMRRRSSMLLMGLGFAFAAMACMSMGPLGLLLPAASAVIFAFWQGRPWRLLRKDFLLCLAFSFLPRTLWAGFIWSEGFHDVVVAMFREQFWGTLMNSLNYPEPWWYYLIILPLLLLPWVLLVIFPHWGGLFSKEMRQAVKGAFRGDHQGLSFVWIALVCAFAGFFLFSDKRPLNLLVLFAPIAIIAGRLTLGLSPMRNMLLQRCYSVLFIGLALVFAVAPVYLSGKAQSVLGWLGTLGVPVIGLEIGGVFIIAAAFLAAGCLYLGAVNSRRPESTLLIMLALMTCVSFPLSTMTGPSLGKMLSPAPLAREIGRYAENGYQPAALDVSPRPFVYYAQREIPQLDAITELNELAASGRFILLADVERWDATPEDFRGAPSMVEAGRFRLAGKDYVLLAHGGVLLPEQSVQEQPVQEPPVQESPALPDELPETPEQATLGADIDVAPDVAPEAETLAEPIASDR